MQADFGKNSNFSVFEAPVEEDIHGNAADTKKAIASVPVVVPTMFIKKEIHQEVNSIPPPLPADPEPKTSASGLWGWLCRSVSAINKFISGVINRMGLTFSGCCF